MEENAVLSPHFYARDCLSVAPELVGKLLCRRGEDGSIRQLRITETEAYAGEQDTACHAHKGRTKRSEVLYAAPGTVYVYLCYGMHWMMNLITGEEGVAQGVLIRACEGFSGPGRLTKALGIDGSFNRRIARPEEGLWLEDDGLPCSVRTDMRVGIGYASPEDQARLWRFIME